MEPALQAGNVGRLLGVAAKPTQVLRAGSTSVQPRHANCAAEAHQACELREVWQRRAQPATQILIPALPQAQVLQPRQRRQGIGQAAGVNAQLRQAAGQAGECGHAGC